MTWLEWHGVDTSGVKIIEGDHTASCFINTDLQDSQLTAFYPGAMAHASTTALADVNATPDDMAIIAPNDPKAMGQYARECTEKGIPYMYDPSMQLPRLSKEELEEGCQGAKVLAGNDYEFGMMAEKMGISEDALRTRVPVTVDDPRRGRLADHRRRHRVRDPAREAGEGRRPHRRRRCLPGRVHARHVPRLPLAGRRPPGAR